MATLSGGFSSSREGGVWVKGCGLVLEEVEEGSGCQKVVVFIGYRRSVGWVFSC